MTRYSSPSWNVQSNTGSKRLNNKDAIYLLNTKFGTWVFTLDIATSSPATIELARSFFDFVTPAALEANIKSHDELKRVIHSAFLQTKTKIRIGKSSFIALYRSHTSIKIIGLTAGDCRAGMIKDKQIQWLTPVQTAANPIGDFTDAMLTEPNRHTLTKCFNLQRPFEPVPFEIDHLNSPIVVATDGFWVELTQDKQLQFINDGLATTQDDTSVIIVTWDKESSPEYTFENNSIENLFFYRSVAAVL